jgi:hypothetical protein
MSSETANALIAINGVVCERQAGTALPLPRAGQRCHLCSGGKAAAPRASAPRPDQLSRRPAAPPPGTPAPPAPGRDSSPVRPAASSPRPCFSRGGAFLGQGGLASAPSAGDWAAGPPRMRKSAGVAGAQAPGALLAAAGGEATCWVLQSLRFLGSTQGTLHHWQGTTER